MKRDWPSGAQTLQRSLRQVLDAAGGVDVARRAEVDRGVRTDVAFNLLEKLDVPSMDPWGEEDEAAAVALSTREAGAVVWPWPVVHQAAVPINLRERVQAIYLIDGRSRRVEHADLWSSCVGVDITGRSAFSLLAGTAESAPLDPFATAVTRGVSVDVTRLFSIWSLHHVLDAFWISGALRTVIDLATTHARDRRQFGRPIGEFGEVRWHLSDMVVAREGLEELALHAWWLLRTARATSADVLALRLHAVESATAVLAHGHQVLAAMGLCEEHDLAVIDRHLQAVLRRPGGVNVTAQQLAEAVRTEGFDGIYQVSPW